ncbi:hypothetical protein A9Z39_18060 [Paenibacillus polymyxa]|nr:hypothetical protein A9Z39_18060 [Paenibacillus polymyxa]
MENVIALQQVRRLEQMKERRILKTFKSEIWFFQKNEETDEVEVAYKEVTVMFKYEINEIYQVHVGGQVIESTYSHLLWI